MSTIILLYCSTMTSLFLFFAKTPLSAGLLLLIQTSIITVSLATLYPTPWLSILLFLVIVGGLMILLIYTSSISPNIKQMSIPSIKPILIIPLFSPIFVIIYFFNKNMKHETSPYFNTENMLSFKKTSANIINFNSSIMTLMMAIYLLLTLIIIVKITNSYLGPMRKTD